MLYCTSCESLSTVLACITAVLRYLLESSAVQAEFAAKATQLQTRLLPLHSDTMKSLPNYSLGYVMLLSVHAVRWW